MKPQKGKELERMKRNDISGFTIKLGRYSLEVVTVCNVPRCIALSVGVKTLWRLEA
jgi:hypothetical protein